MSAPTFTHHANASDAASAADGARAAPAWRDLIDLFPPLPGQRQIISVRVTSMQTSCGFGVPRYHFEGHRDQLEDWARRKGEAGLREYRLAKNAKSIDGLPTGALE